MAVKCPVNPNGRLEETAAMMEGLIMWIKTHAGNLVNADKLLSIEIAECKTGFQVWGYTADGNIGFILGQYPTKEEAAQAEVEICIKMNHENIMRMPEYKW